MALRGKAKEISADNKNPNGMSGTVPIVAPLQKKVTKGQGLLTFKPYVHFWSKWEPKLKDNVKAGSSGQSLMLDVRKQSKVIDLILLWGDGAIQTAYEGRIHV